MVLGTYPLQIIHIGEYVNIRNFVEGKLLSIFSIDGEHFEWVVPVDQTILIFEDGGVFYLGRCKLCYINGTLKFVLDHEAEVERV